MSASALGQKTHRRPSSSRQAGGIPAYSVCSVPLFSQLEGAQLIMADNQLDSFYGFKC